MGQSKIKNKTREERVLSILKQRGVKVITKERSDAFISWTRKHTAKMTGIEIEHYSNDPETLIGIIVFDITDHDYSIAILARDRKMRFRYIDGKTGLTKQQARKLLIEKIQYYSNITGVCIFPQGDEDKDGYGIDLFNIQAEESKLNSTFKILQTNRCWTPAKRIITEMMRNYEDIDRNFVQQFQTSAFDARLWELYLYNVFLEEGLYIERPKPAPDFYVRRGRFSAFIEAVTVNPSSQESKKTQDKSILPKSIEEINRINHTIMPVRFGRALNSKVQKHYEINESVKGKPLILAIADFHEQGSMMWTHSALPRYLYGREYKITKTPQRKIIIIGSNIDASGTIEGKSIPKEFPPGFFFRDDTKFISAVMFSSTGTLSKFNRMGMIAGFGEKNQKMMRMGCCINHKENAIAPLSFIFDIRPGNIKETWAEGMSIFHNPNAEYPLDKNLFPEMAQHWYEKGDIISTVPKFHPLWSLTNIFFIDE